MDVDGLNAGYAGDLLEDYLENPDAVPSEWRRLFESGASEVVAANPGLVRLLETLEAHGNGQPAAPSPAKAPPEQVSDELLGGVDVRPGVRLLGVSVSGLTGASDREARQLSFGDLDGPSDRRGGAASEALDAVRARFGTEAVGPASLAGPEGIDVKRQGDTQWGPRSAEPGSG